jgi:flagellar protein FliO/FliZ
VTSPIADYLVESFLVLLVIVGLAALFLYGARRAGLRPGRGLGSIELLARLPLEPRRSVYVVRVLDQVLILGASEAGLAKLGELPESAAALLRETDAPASFAAVLDAALRSRRAPGKGAGEPGRAVSPLAPPGGSP